MRCIIAAAGNGDRWGDYLGLRKHQVPINGVPIIKRTIDQFQSAGITPLVLCHPDHVYEYAGARYTTVVPDPDSSIHKVASSSSLWSSTDRTLLVFGDVYFSNRAFRRLLKDDGHWTVYGRIGKAKYGKKLHSLFAISVHPADHDFLVQSFQEFRAIDVSGRVPSGGRLLYWYQHVTGQRFHPTDLVDKGHFIRINDVTDDVDKPSHYNQLKRAVAKARGAK